MMLKNGFQKVISLSAIFSCNCVTLYFTLDKIWNYSKNTVTSIVAKLEEVTKNIRFWEGNAIIF